MGMIGNQPANNFLSVTKDTFNGNASSYTLSKAATTNGVAVYVENVRQIPTTAYSVSGTTLTFTGTTPAGSNNVYVLHHNSPASTATHPAAQDLTAVNGTMTGTLAVTGTSTLTGATTVGGTSNLTIADGDLVIGTGGHGIDFANASAGTGGAGTDPTETSTATVLDDYEEGTFTPTSNSVYDGTITQVGMYVKVGNMVNVSVRFTPSGSSTNGHQFGIHLPFKAATTQASGSYNTWFGNGMFSSANSNGQDRIWGIGGDGNYVNIRQQGASSASEITGNSMGGSFNMSFSITYQTID